MRQRLPRRLPEEGRALKRRLLELAAIAFWFLTGCAGATVRGSGLGPLPTRSLRAPILRGESGETPTHLYARLAAHFCIADESEREVRRALEAIQECREDGRYDCQREACEVLRGFESFALR